MISRTIFAAVFLASTALAAPRLTTIQDVLYKADGTRFNGTLVIAWSSFQAGDASQIATQTTSAKVVDGNLRVQLVPTDGSSPRMVYTVTYNSDGRVQFQETWAVPASAQPVRLRDIRVDPSTLTSTDIIGGNGTTSVQESDVVGLTADLGARPLKGPGYAAGRLAFVNSSGAIEGVTGSPIDCVRVDGTATSCGGGGSAAFVDADTPSGIVDGANTQFNLSEAPDPASSLSLYRNGLLMSGGQDYSLNGQTLTFVSKAAPQPGDTLVAWYRLTAADDLGVSFIDGESPTGTLDGTNTQFTLSALPTPISSLVVFRNGVLQKAGQDYTLNGQLLTFVTAAVPQAGDSLLASYRLAGNGTGTGTGTGTTQTYPSPQILCSGTGGTTSSVTLASMGTCSIPPGILLPGDRVEVRFDLEHQGTATGFVFEMHWGGTVVAHRDATASDVLVTARIDAGMLAAGAQLSFQSWGAVLPFAAGVANSTDVYTSGLTIDFQGRLASAAGDSVAMRAFTVVRIQ